MRFILINLITKPPYLPVLIVILFYGCSEEIIDIDFSSFEKHVVIESVISDRKEEVNVKLSKVDSFFEEGISSSISGSKVSISDDSGNVEQLEEITPGSYRANELVGIPGRIYKLTVNANGQTYFATSRMPEPVEVSSIESEFVSFNNYNLIIYLADKKDVQEYCRIRIYRNNYLIDEKLYHDKNSDGETVRIEENYFHRMDKAAVEIITINENIYRYLLDLKELSESDDSEAVELVQLTAGNPNTNLSNNALGYFSAQTYRKYIKIIQ